MPPVDLFGSTEGLNIAEPVEGVNLFADPNAPGPFRKGIGAGVAGVKSSFLGAGALAAHAIGATGLEKAALESVAEQGAIASENAQPVEKVDWSSPGAVVNQFKFLLGQAIPSLATMFAGGVVGRGLGAVAGRTMATRAAAESATRTGMFAGAVAPDVAMEAGSIYPEALETGVANPGLRAAAGGVAAASLDFLPLLAAERYLKAAGRGGFGAMAKGAAKGAPVGALLEGTQEALQTGVERLAAGHELTGPEAVSDYLNSFAAGAAPGTVLGGAVGAARGRAPAVQQPAPFTERELSTIPEQPPIVDTQVVDTSAQVPTLTPDVQHAAATQAMADTSAAIEQVRAEHEAAGARMKELEAEAKLPNIADRRTMSDIVVERKALTAARKATKGKITALETQYDEARKAAVALEPQIAAMTAAANIPDLGTIDPNVGIVEPAAPVAPAPKTEAEHVQEATKGAEAFVTQQGLAPAPVQIQAKTSKRAGQEPATVNPAPARDTITPASDTSVGKNAAGEVLYDRADGSRYRMHRGRPDFGGDLVPSTAAKTGIVNPSPVAKVDKATGAARDQMKAREPALRELITSKLKGSPGGKATIADATLRRLTLIAQNAHAETTPEAQVAYIKGEIVKQGLDKRFPAKELDSVVQDIHGAVVGAATRFSKGAIRNFKNLTADEAENLSPAELEQAIAYFESKAPLDTRGRGHKSDADIMLEFLEDLRGETQNSVAALTSDQFELLPQAAKEAAVDYYDRVMTERGNQLIQRVRDIVGPANLTVTTFTAAPGSPIGGYTRTGPLKAMISLALNAKNGLSVADHEGFHAAEDLVLNGHERQIITNALKNGRPLFNRLLEKVQQYDLENKTNLADEIQGVPAERRAYAFEFWKRGELEADGPLQRVFQKIQQFLERIANAVNGLGFQSIEDIFTALDRGQYSERTRNEASGIAGYDSRGAVELNSKGAADYQSIKATPGVDMVRMAKLLGPQLYGNMADIGPVTIKEMFQNSFDALKGAINIGQQSEGRISIDLDPDKRTITLTDNGTGMTPETINKAFLTLAGTAKETDRASGGLGIAKMLFLFGNKQLKLVTVRDGVESTLETSGEQLIASFSDPSKAPSIQTRATDSPSGTTVEVTVPETYHDEDSDTDKAVGFPSGYDAKHLLIESPLFEPIDVEINGYPVAIGKSFPADQYTVLTVAKFAWGKVRVLVAETEYPGYSNVSVLSNGLYQFGDKISKDPTEMFSGSAPYKFFFNLEPDVKADAPNYPIALNRKGFSQSAQSDFKALMSYIGVLYANKKDEAGSHSFGTLMQVAENGTQAAQIDLNIPPAKVGTTLSINKGDKVEVRDGRLYVNSREMPELTKEKLKDMKRDPAQFRVDQGLLDPEKLIIHDNVLLDGKPYLDEAAKEVGAGELSGYLRGIGSVFKSVRDAVAREGGLDYADVAQVPVGVSVDTEYYGVNTAIPFKAMMINPALVRDANPDTAPVRMVSTMIHELAHHKEKNHSETGFIPELQRLGVVLALSKDTQNIVADLRQVLEKYSNVLDYFTRTAKNGHLTNRGIRLDGDAEAAGSESVSGGVSGSSRARGDGSNIPGVRIAAAPRGEGVAAGYERAGASETTVPVTLFSKAAVDMDRQMKAGELQQMQANQAGAALMEATAGTSATWRATTEGLGLEAVGGFKRWWEKYISTPNFIAHYSNGFKNVFRVLNTYNRYRSVLIKQMLKEQMPEWYTARKSDQDAAFAALTKRNVGKFVKGSPEYQDLLATLTPEQQTMFASATLTPEQQTMFASATLTPEQQTMFASATRMVEGFLLKELEVDKVFYKKAYSDPKDYDSWLAGRQTQVDDLIAHGYEPLERFGDHTVTVLMPFTDAKGRVQTLAAVHQQFESLADAHKMAEIYKAELARTGSTLSVETGIRHKNSRDATISVQQFLDTARRNGVALSQPETERIVKALTAADSMVRNRMMRRKEVPGYSADGMRVLNSFGVKMAGKVAYAKFASAIDASLHGTAVDADLVPGPGGEMVPEIVIDALRSETETADDLAGRNLWKLEGGQGGFARNLADEVSDYVLVPDHTGMWSRKLRAAAMMYFIGGSISGAVVNVMSIPMLLVPELSIHTDYHTAAAASLSAWKLTWQHQAILRDIVRLKDKDNNPLPGIDEVAGLREALITASEDGRTMDTEIHQITGMAQGAMFSQSRTVQKAMEVWMSPFRLSEQTNRITAFIAAYKVAATGKGIKQSDGSFLTIGGQELYRFAGEMVDSTQNNYNAANRPGAARHPVYAMMFMFKSFPLFMTEAIVLMHKANPKSAVYMLLGLTMMTGVQGLPFAETLMDLIDVLSQRVFGSPFNTRRAMRNVIKSASEAMVGYNASDLVMRGMLNEVLGISMASRIGAGDFVPGTRLGAADADQGRILQDLLGAPYAMVKDGAAQAGKFVGGVFTGDWKQTMDALRAGGPIAIRNAIKGSEQLVDGFASDARGRKVTDVSGLEAMLQLTGLAPATVAKMYDYESINIQTKAFYNQVSRDMQDQLVQALKDNDATKVQEINDLRNAWNQSYPTMQILPNAAAARRAIILGGVPLDRRSQMLWGRRIRGENVFSEGSE